MTDDVTKAANNDEQQSTDALAESEKVPELKDAINYIVHGKRHMLCHDFNSAVTSLEEATRIYDQIYGTGADECGDAYLYYGSALLELSRQETGALDGGVVSANINDPSEEDSDDDGDDDGEEEGGDVEEPAEGDETPNDAAEVDGTDPAAVETVATDEDLVESDGEPGAGSSTVTVSSVVKDQPAGTSASTHDNGGPGPCSSSSAEPVAGSSSGVTEEAKEQEEDTEASSAEIAWEVLGLARDVYRRQVLKGNEYRLRLAEALQKLGEISIEWENYETAIEILEESLSLRKESLPEDDRLIAETYYHIGVCFSFSSEHERANDCYRSAIDVIEQRIKNLKADILTAAEVTDEVSQKELEIIELEGLLPEMQAKIEDSRDQMNNAINASEILKSAASEDLHDQAVMANIKDSPSKPVNNIAHLVKRKRESSGGEPSAKKSTVPEETKAGSSNGSSNGTTAAIV